MSSKKAGGSKKGAQQASPNSSPRKGGGHQQNQDGPQTSRTGRSKTQQEVHLANGKHFKDFPKMA